MAVLFTTSGDILALNQGDFVIDSAVIYLFFSHVNLPYCCRWTDLLLLEVSVIFPILLPIANQRLLIEFLLVSVKPSANKFQRTTKVDLRELNIFPEGW